MIHWLARGALVALFLVSASLPVHGQTNVPAALEDWRGWVLHGEAYRQCPFLASAPPTNRDSFRCAWPERLTLSVSERGGTFAQRWQVFAESWIQLPGSTAHWPHDVRVNGAPAAVVSRNGNPVVRLPAGSHTVSGALGWSTRPEILPLDPRTAIVELTVDGVRIAQPDRPGGAISLGRQRGAAEPQRLQLQVYRLVRDTVPVTLETRIRLQVSGEGREELLARVLPDDFVPMSLESVLPARLEPDGRLRVQVRAGSWEITMKARGANVASELSRPEARDGWPEEEIWSFAAVDRLRVATVQGAEGIDPLQANVPEPWWGYPAFRMPTGATLTVVERTRGLENADDNQLRLDRQMWLDFDHGGMTVIDHITGTMRRDWRLEMTAPFSLQSASSRGETLLVTRSPDGEGVGVELRTPRLDLTAVARTQRSSGEMPATGWTTRFEEVDGTLILPPGHRLLAAIGADSAPYAWIERWGLWGLFGVLVVAVFSGWLAGWPAGVAALAGLILMYQEAPGYVWLWANLIGAVALARAAPEGRLLRFARVYRALSLFVLGIALLPFFWTQLKVALYPQLDERLMPLGPAVQVQLTTLPASRAAAAEDAAATEEVRVEAAEPAKMESKAPPGVAGSAARYGSPLQRYAPGTLLQAGPGVPEWQYEVYPYEWSGPVEPEQSVRFVYIGPVLLGLWRIAGIVLLAVLFFLLMRADGVGRPAICGLSWPRIRMPGTAAAACIAMLAALAAPAARGADTPDPALLEELKRRLTAPPECAPECADLMSARVQVRQDRLEVVLEVAALARVAVPVPGAGDRWQLDTVTVDGRSALTIAREGDGSLWIPVESGVHTVRLAGALAPADAIPLAFPRAPRRVSVSSDGWDVSGVSEGRLISGALELVRRRTDATQSPVQSVGEFPPFVHVRRHFDLGLEWTLSSTVERIAPERAALSVRVPLVPGESVLTPGIEVTESEGTRLALVGLGAGQSSVRWSSGLPRSDGLTLQLPAGANRSETWTFAVGPQWNVTFEGLPAVLPEAPDGPIWIYEFHPRPGERLTLNVRRPLPAEGSTLAIDRVVHTTVLGRRSSTSTLNFTYRSTQGGRHTLALPQSARVTALQIDGQPVQLRPDDGELSIGLLPGEHSVGVEWTTPTGIGLVSRPEPVDLRASAANVLTMLTLPADRWPLLASGPGVGAVVLYWVELAIFLPVAWLLGRWRHSPLKTYEWLLLGVGLSTLSWVVLVIVGVWLFAMRWRESWTGDVARWRFNAVQVLLAVLTVIATGSLIFWGVRESLLATPDMGIAGPGSVDDTFGWFLDRTESALPQPRVISVPMWVYRALMFAWALWIVVALLRWLRWAWQAWKTNGIWRGKVLDAPAA